MLLLFIKGKFYGYIVHSVNNITIHANKVIVPHDVVLGEGE